MSHVVASIDCISQANIKHLFIRKGKHVRKVLIPSFFIQQWLIKAFFTWINVNPTVLKPYFSPCMICKIENLPGWVAKGHANCCETISPLLTSANLGLKQFYWMIVSWEPYLYLAILALVAFNFACMKFSVLVCWSGISPTFHFVLSFASWALRSIHPLKKVMSEPFKQSYHLFFA